MGSVNGSFERQKSIKSLEEFPGLPELVEETRIRPADSNSLKSSQPNKETRIRPADSNSLKSSQPNYLLRMGNIINCFTDFTNELYKKVFDKRVTTIYDSRKNLNAEQLKNIGNRAKAIEQLNPSQRKEGIEELASYIFNLCLDQENKLIELEFNSLIEHAKMYLDPNLHKLFEAKLLECKYENFPEPVKERPLIKNINDKELENIDNLAKAIKQLNPNERKEGIKKLASCIFNLCLDQKNELIESKFKNLVASAKRCLDTNLHELFEAKLLECKYEIPKPVKERPITQDNKMQSINETTLENSQPDYYYW